MSQKFIYPYKFEDILLEPIDSRYYIRSTDFTKEMSEKLIFKKLEIIEKKLYRK